MTTDDLFAEPSAVNRMMNQLIKQGAQRGVNYGDMAQRESGVPDPEVARERLSAALSDLESAAHRGDEWDLEQAESRLTALIDESRQSRGAQPRSATGQFAESGSDGGMRGPRPPRPGSRTVDETANALFARAIETSRQERNERRADPGETLSWRG